MASLPSENSRVMTESQTRDDVILNEVKDLARSSARLSRAKS